MNGQRRSENVYNIEAFKLLLFINVAHNKGRDVYGAPKIQTELAEQGIHVAINRIKRLHRLHGISCIHKRKFKATTQYNHTLPVISNVLHQQFDNTTEPNQVWLADIIYIYTDEGWLLAAVKDLHTYGSLVGQ